MGTHYHTKTVTDGLVFCLDALNPKSYPGSGSTWSDISATAASGSLVGSPVYTSGYISLNGSTQYASFGSQTLGVSAASKTMCAWIYPTSFPNNPIGILDNDGYGNTGGPTNYGWGFWMSNSGKLWYWPKDNLDIIDGGSKSVALNTWNHVAISYNFSTKTATFYYNGVSSGTGTTTGTELAPATGQFLLVGNIRNAAQGTFNFAGRIAGVSLYNRVLSDTEIAQNFNAMRGRFGI